jgi:hypothetical protein
MEPPKFKDFDEAMDLQPWWELYKKAMLHPAASAIQVESMKHSFFSGMTIFLRLTQSIPERFEEKHGRAATDEDIAFYVKKVADQVNEWQRLNNIRFAPGDRN